MDLYKPILMISESVFLNKFVTKYKIIIEKDKK